MKKLLSISVLFLFGLSVSITQELQYHGIESFKRIDSIVTYDYHLADDSIRNNKIVYDYGSLEKPSLLTHFQWDTINYVWKSYYRNEYSYDMDGNLTLEASYQWNKGLNDWIGINKEEYSYDTFGNRTMVKKYIWDFIM